MITNITWITPDKISQKFVQVYTLCSFFLLVVNLKNSNIVPTPIPNPTNIIAQSNNNNCGTGKAWTVDIIIQCVIVITEYLNYYWS